MEDYRKLIEREDLEVIGSSEDLDLIFEMSARYGKMKIINKFIFDQRINWHTKEAAFTNACKYGQRYIAKFIYDSCIDDKLNFSSTWMTMRGAIRHIIRRGYFAMLHDYRHFLVDHFSLAINDMVLWEMPSIEAVKVLDSMGTDIVNDVNFKIAVETGSVKIVEFFHKRGATLETQHILRAQNINAYDVVVYLAENGFEPTTDFYKRYVNFRKKVKAKRERRLANIVYYTLIAKIYTPGSDSANRLGWASYNASVEGRLL
jgi:hypothetical protein